MTAARWRVGRSIGRTIYEHGECVGMVDTPELALMIVEALNVMHPGAEPAGQTANNIHCPACDCTHPAGKCRSATEAEGRCEACAYCRRPFDGKWNHSLCETQLRSTPRTPPIELPRCPVCRGTGRKAQP